MGGWGIGRKEARGSGGGRKSSVAEYSPLHSFHLLMKAVKKKWNEGRRKEGKNE